MSTPANQLDIVTVATAAALAIFGNPQVADFAGPYAVIILCAVLGASVSGSGESTAGHRGTLAHLAMGIGLALVATVPLSLVLAHYTGFEARWMLGPVAVVVGWRNLQITTDLALAVSLARAAARRAWGAKE